MYIHSINREIIYSNKIIFELNLLEFKFDSNKPEGSNELKLESLIFVCSSFRCVWFVNLTNLKILI